MTALHARPATLADSSPAVLISVDGVATYVQVVDSDTEAQAWTLAARLMWTGWSEGGHSAGPWPSHGARETIAIDLDAPLLAHLTALAHQTTRGEDTRGEQAHASVAAALGGDEEAARRCVLEAILYERLIAEIDVAS